MEYEIIQTRFGKFHRISIPVTKELLEQKKACDFDGQHDLAAKTFKDARRRTHDRPYIVFSEFNWAGHPQRCHAVTVEWDKEALAAFDRCNPKR